MIGYLNPLGRVPTSPSKDDKEGLFKVVIRNSFLDVDHVPGPVI